MKKILVIEDNTEVRENLCEILELANYETYQAENGKIGIQKVKESQPDLIICDVMMPELDGFGVLRILNRDPQYMNIPFLFLTAKAEMADFRKGMGLGADDYITKPFDEVDLMDAIEMRLKKSDKITAIPDTSDRERSFYSETKANQSLKNLSEDREHRNYDKKSIIYRDGQYPKYLYRIISGAIKSIQINDVGKDLISNIYGPGDFVGLVSLIQNREYHESAICTEDTEVLMIPAADFRKLLFNDRDFNAKFLGILADYVGQVERQLVDQAYSSVRKKVANALSTLANKSNSLTMSASREDLAGMAGTSRESVIRTISDFKSEGLVDINGGQIIILQKEKIENLPQ